MKNQVQRIILIASLCAFVNASIKWIGIKNFPFDNEWAIHDVCSKKYGFTWRQVRFCRHQFPWMFFTQDAAKTVAEECQSVLRKHDWNCQSINKAPTFNTDLKRDTKESAFVHALSASALAVTVARGCMAGKLENCLCQLRKQRASFPSNFVDRDNASRVNDMVGCKGILNVGQKFAHDFMNAGIRWKPKSERHKQEISVRQHNYQLGLKALDGGEYISCTCNGATAGCTMKFCHRRLKLFQDVTNKLLTKLEKAIQTTDKDFKKLYQSVEFKRNSKDIYQKSETYKNDLVYLDQVDHCLTKGMYSSTGRRCSLDDSSINSCNKICCGKGHRVRRIEIHSKCRCKFVYCCEVRCDTCIRYDEIFECL